LPPSGSEVGRISPKNFGGLYLENHGMSKKLKTCRKWSKKCLNTGRVSARSVIPFPPTSWHNLKFINWKIKFFNYLFNLWFVLKINFKTFICPSVQIALNKNIFFLTYSTFIKFIHAPKKSRASRASKPLTPNQ
jgi:hypothetical protein